MFLSGIPCPGDRLQPHLPPPSLPLPLLRPPEPVFVRLCLSSLGCDPRRPCSRDTGAIGGLCCVKCRPPAGLPACLEEAPPTPRGSCIQPGQCPACSPQLACLWLEISPETGTGRPPCRTRAVFPGLEAWWSVRGPRGAQDLISNNSGRPRRSPGSGAQPSPRLANGRTAGSGVRGPVAEGTGLPVGSPSLGPAGVCPGVEPSRDSPLPRLSSPACSLPLPHGRGGVVPALVPKLGRWSGDPGRLVGWPLGSLLALPTQDSPSAGLACVGCARCPAGRVLP